MRRCLGILAVAPFALAAQQPPTMSLQPADAVLKLDVSGLSALRELRDGRVIVSTGRDNYIGVVDFAAKKVTRIGQVPGQSRQFVPAGLLYRFAGDSTVNEVLSTRANVPPVWIIFDGTTVAGQLPPTSPVLSAVRSVPTGGDVLGHLLTVQASHSQPGEPLQGTDSMYLVLVDHATAEQDTVAHIAEPSGPGPVLRPGDTLNVFNRSYESAVLAPDGWIAVVRLDPYRIDWRSPAGEWVHGPPVPVVPVPLTDAEKEPYRYRVAKERYPENPAVRWPATLPPIEGTGRPMPTLDGHLLVARLHTLARPGQTYDVIDRHGTLVEQVTMPADRRIYGFGAHSVYVGITANDGAFTLERHPWP